MNLLLESNDGEMNNILAGNLMEIESRKDKDAFFDSLGGWNSNDKMGKKQAAIERRKRKREEKEVRIALKHI